MFKKILIANRGEIALRIIRTCKQMGIPTVVIYSEADRDSRPVKLAAESVCIGASPANESYLNIPAIISAAEVTGVDAIHPGYGFLAEDTYFADVCESCGIKFIGPSRETILKAGDKVKARKIMSKAKVPVIPGSEDTVDNLEQALKIAHEIKYPLIIKAAAGGGGKGMRIANDEEGLKAGYEIARSEAKASFGNDKVYIEKYITQPKHIEFQILGDKNGHYVWLPERNCTIQRRHQKLIEESPSPGVDDKLRKRMGAMAIRVAKAVNYTTAGTVEFLLDKKGNYYFLEMNTRIQVEHPVSELVSGLDLIKEQIELAAGKDLAFRQNDVKLLGHALECRINAEDPEKDFIPSTGKIENFLPPGGPGVRVDTHVYAGYTIPPFYDSMIAKVITLASRREEAIKYMRRCLEEFVVEGIKTTIPFHLKVMKNAYFQKGEIYTDFLQKHIFTPKSG